MATTVEISAITHTVTDVEDVIVTEAAQDEQGYYVRDIRVYGQPASEGGDAEIVLVVRLKSMTATKVELTAPPQVY